MVLLTKAPIVPTLQRPAKSQRSGCSPTTSRPLPPLRSLHPTRTPPQPLSLSHPFDPSDRLLNTFDFPASLPHHSFPLLTAHLAAGPDPASSAILGTTYLPGRASALTGAAEGPSFGTPADGGLGGGAAAVAAKKKKDAAKGSRGVEALKKVNTKGMKSLKDMFGGGAGGARGKK